MRVWSLFAVVFLPSRLEWTRFGHVLLLVSVGAVLFPFAVRAQTVDHLVEWNPAFYTVGELGHSISLTAKRSGPSFFSGTVVVDYSVSGGTATADLDYELTSGTLRFSYGFGDWSSVSVRIKDDTLVEGTETIRVALRNPRLEDGATGNVLLGTNFEAVVSILDNDSRSGPGQGSDGAVFSNAVQADGKLYISGDFDYVNGRFRPKLARLNPDLSLDTSFDPGSGYEAVGGVQMVPLSDGKLMMGGSFPRLNGVKRQCVARLNPDGSVDTSFDVGEFFGQASNPAMISAIVPLPDGKLLLGGTFGGIQVDVGGGFYRDINRSGIMRVNPTGEVDTSFNPALGTLDVFSLLAQRDGKVLVFGYRIEANGYKFIASRLYPNGGVDTSYRSPALPLNFTPDTAVLLRDSSVVLCGYNGTIKLKPDGTLDESFQIDASLFPVRRVAQQFDDRLLAAGGWGLASFNRIRSDGSVDNSFAAGVNGSVMSIAVLPGGRIFIGGYLTAVHNVARPGFALLEADGQLVGTIRLGLQTDSRDQVNRLTSLDVSDQPSVLEASQNMIDWIPIFTNSPGQILDFREPVIERLPHKFYRVVPEP